MDHQWLVDHWYLWIGIMVMEPGAISLDAIAFATGLVIRINNMAAWVMRVITGIFENIGTGQEGMETISKPHIVVDTPDAQPLKVSQGEICYEHVRIAYDDNNAVSEKINKKPVSRIH